jgi:acyl-CoA dehydrogenase
MDSFMISDELKMIVEQVRRIIEDDVIPAENRVDPDAPELAEEDYRRINKKVRNLGLYALELPKKYGGGGLGTFEMSVIAEAMGQHRMGLYNIGCGVFGRHVPESIWAGSEEQIEQYAVPTIKSGHHTFFAITEPGGGSDPANSIQTRAEKKGDKYILNGSKIFISHAHEAEWGVVYARSNPEAGRKGISAFIVETKTPGFTAKPFQVIRTAAVPNVVTFEDCEIPAKNRIGEDGQGLSLALNMLSRKRFPYSATNLSVAVAAQKRTVEYANQRKTFGEYLADRQAIQWMLADNELDIRTSRLLIWDGAMRADRDEDIRVLASMAKVYSSEALGRVIDRCVQIHGGYGVTKEFPLERWYREARVRRIGEGPSEVHRMVISRDLLRAGRDQRKARERSQAAAPAAR